ncbi:hypothetical protein EXS74_00175 [Candidatus Woesearchaeota archaeon]|nr:hypothetical protein [Candidatus Woesearchaeota archaeon]
MVSSKVVKCPGRFSQTREKVFEAVDVALEGRINVTEHDLATVWDLISGDLAGLDGRDPYYEPTEDVSRTPPHDNYLSLVPLFPSTYTLTPEIREKHALSRGVDPRIAIQLAAMASSGRNFFTGQLGKDAAKLHVDKNVTLSGYVIGSNVGVGTLSDGGPEGGGTRSDSPYLIEISKREGRGRDERLNLAAVVGFWAEGDTMLVSQMQSCKNATLPEGPYFGLTCVTIAERVAREIGFEKIALYTGRAHPYFLEHHESWARMGQLFVCMWDGSAKKLGFDGSRVQTRTYTKTIGTGIRERL